MSSKRFELINEVDHISLFDLKYKGKNVEKFHKAFLDVEEHNQGNKWNMIRLKNGDLSDLDLEDWQQIVEGIVKKKIDWVSFMKLEHEAILF